MNSKNTHTNSQILLTLLADEDWKRDKKTVKIKLTQLSYHYFVDDPIDMGEPWKSKFPLIRTVLEWIAQEGFHQFISDVGRDLVEGKHVEANPIEGIKWMEIAAFAGYHNAGYELGKYYLNGKWIEKDFSKGLDWLEKTALAGYQNSMMSLARIWLKGIEVEPDPIQAKKWLLMGAESGNKDIIYHLGNRLLTGDGVEKDPVLGQRWLDKLVVKKKNRSKKGKSTYQKVKQWLVTRPKEATLKEDVEQLWRVGESPNQEKQEQEEERSPEEKQMFQLANRLGEKNRVALRQWMDDQKQMSSGEWQQEDITDLSEEQAKKMREIQSMFDQGRKLIVGNGVKKDKKRGKELLVEVAESGYSLQAMLELGIHLIDGKYLSMDTVQGEKWLERAVEANYQNAILELAKRRLEGHGIQKNRKSGLELFEKAANLGNTESMLELGRRLLDGKGIEQHTKEGHKWLENAAHQGNKDAMLELGKRLSKGKGLQKDRKQAKYWYELAANAGYKDVMFKLGKLLIEGKDIKRNLVEGRNWLQTIAECGDVQAAFELGKNMLEEPQGKRDVQEGRLWLIQAAQDGYPQAMDTLGEHLITANHFHRNVIEGRKWLERAILRRNKGFTPIFHPAIGRLEKLLKSTYLNLKKTNLDHIPTDITWIDKLTKYEGIKDFLVRELTEPYQMKDMRYFFGGYPIYKRDELDSLFFQQKLRSMMEKELVMMDKSLHFFLTEHAKERWNERIGPVLLFDEIKELVTILWKADRIDFYASRIGVIDDEIVFAYRLDRKKIVITTFLGRLSLKPELADYELTKWNMLSYGDSASLKVQKSVIEKQSIPIMPREFIHFQSRDKTEFMLLEYEFIDQQERKSLFQYYEINNNPRKKTISFHDVYQPDNKKIHVALLRIMYLKGYEQYVLSYLAYHYDEEFVPLLTKVGNGEPIDS